MIVEYDLNTIIPFMIDRKGLPFRVSTQTDPRIMAAMSGYENYQVIKKSEDSFLDDKNKNRQEVVNFFRNNKIRKIIMTGANGGACVAKSIRDALRNGCEVVSYSRGIADFNYEPFIYPYSGLYDNFIIQVNAGTCGSDCAIQEVHSLDSLTPFMRVSGSAPQSTPLTDQRVVQ